MTTTPFGDQRKHIWDWPLSPSLKLHLEQIFTDCYPDTRHQASLETGLSMETFPVACLYPISAILSPDFRPEV